MDYRLYFENEAGHFAQAVWLEGRDDDHAIEVAATHHDGRSMELWERSRLVKRFPTINKMAG
jgi:hypothetical protein